MILNEYICGLFSDLDFCFPEGEFPITISKNLSCPLNSIRMVLLNKKKFAVSEELKDFYTIIEENELFKNRFPYYQERGILINESFFSKFVKTYCLKDKKRIETILGLTSRYYCLYIKMEHSMNGTILDLFDYLNSIRGKEGMEIAKKHFFSAIGEFFDYVTIFRSPYINITDLNYRHVKGVFAFFCDTDNRVLTNIRPITFDYWEPKVTPAFKKHAKDFFDKKVSIPLDELFMAKAKVYSRLENYSMAIIHAVISLEIVVPGFINKYLRTHGVDPDSIQDFNNKFGISVRVKTILKLILPFKDHYLIKNVGTTIKYRNKIMHEGKTNEFFVNINVEELVNDCEKLAKLIKKKEKLLKENRKQTIKKKSNVKANVT